MNPAIEDYLHPIRQDGSPGCDTRRARVDAGLHALRHFYASALIRHGENVKTVQRRMGHSSSATALDTYIHLWPDFDDRTRQAVERALSAPAGTVRTTERSY